MDATIWRIVGYFSIVGFVGCLVAFIRGMQKYQVRDFVYSIISAFITLGISEAFAMYMIYNQISATEMRQLNAMMNTHTAELIMFTIGTTILSLLFSTMICIFLFKHKAGLLPLFSTAALLSLHTFSIAYIVIY